jgi:hypothetical protein
VESVSQLSYLPRIPDIGPFIAKQRPKFIELNPIVKVKAIK